LGSLDVSINVRPKFAGHLWSWGGILLNDQVDEEYKQLENETRVPISEIPLALTAFDEIFPIKGGWFRDLDDRRVLILMPTAIRGLGAHLHRLVRGVESFENLLGKIQWKE